MRRILEWLRRLWKRQRREPPLVLEVHEPPKPPPAEPGPSHHRRRQLDAERRRLERARMKHDVWVSPGGPEPVGYERGEGSERKTTEEPLPSVDGFVDPNDRLIAGEWVEGDGGGDVLFEQSEFYGTFNFRDTILTQLDRYWIYIERMKRNDPQSYAFYKQLGATLLPYIATRSNIKHEYFKKIESGEELEMYKAAIKLSPWFKKTWPAFGCIAYAINPLDEEHERVELSGNLWAPKFIYFTRIQTDPWPWYVQPVTRGKGRLYLMTTWWDRPDHPKTRQKWGVPNDFPIWVSDDGGTIRALKTREATDGTIRPEGDWRIPHAYAHWAKSYGLTAQIHLPYLFAQATGNIERSYYATCRVEINKGDLTAVFGIEPPRIPYFFKDRDVTLNEHGHKERIFHVVRAHTRNGVAVPMQFRGLKEFDWAGYHVRITVPGRDHLLLQEFDMPCMVLKGKKKRRSELSMADIAGWLKSKVRMGLRASR